MKELDSFTVERLEEILNFDLPRHPAALEEIVALARIALAAKRAEPVDEIAFDMARGIMALVNETNIGGACQLQAKIQCFIEENLTTTPQLNSQQGWIKCSDQMPESQQWGLVWAKWFNQQVLCWEDVGGQWTDFDGQSYSQDQITHWMPLPAAPEKPL